MRRFIALLAVLGFALVACGDDEPTVVADDTTTTTSTTAVPADEGGSDDDDADADADDDAADEPADEPLEDRAEFLGGYAFDAETGEVDVTEYDAFLAVHGAPDDGLEAAALELLGGPYEGEDGVSTQVTSDMADGGRTVVTVIYEDLPDDSIAAVRFEFVFVGDGDDVIIESGSWASRCQEGRGHQEFSTGLCV